MADKETVTTIIDYASSTTGAVAGGVVGCVVGGPTGAIGGAVIGALAQKLVADVMARNLSTTEKARVVEGAEIAISLVEQYRREGREARADFCPDEDGLSPATELLEGVLLKCRDSYQEKKVKHLAAFYAGVAFDHSVSIDRAHHYLVLLDAISYSQLKIMSLVHRAKELNFKTYLLEYPEGTLEEQTALRSQVDGLTDWKKILSTGQKEINENGNRLTVKPYYLSDMATGLVKLAKIDEVPASELEELMGKFKAFITLGGRRVG